MNPKIKEKLSKIKDRNPAVLFRKGKLSIQASEYNYCSPKSNKGPYKSFEVAYLENDNFVEIPELTAGGDNDQVYGYVPVKDVVSLLLNEGYNKKEILEILPR